MLVDLGQNTPNISAKIITYNFKQIYLYITEITNEHTQKGGCVFV